MTANYVLVNRGGGKVLDGYNWSITNGANIFQWTDANGNNQQWQLIRVG